METDRIATRTPTPNPSASIEVEISDTQSHLVADHECLEGLVRRVLAAEGIENASISMKDSPAKERR